MDFSTQSVWDMTKLFVSDPAEASRRILQQGWPVNISVIMIILSGIISGVMWGVDQALFGAEPEMIILPDGREVAVAPFSPVTVGVISAILGLVFSYFVYSVGKRSGGTGTLASVLSVLAALQLALTVLGVLTGFLAIALPLLGIAIALFVIFVSLRGYGHAVMQSHGFDAMGAAVFVIIGASVLAAILLAVLLIFLMPILMPDLINEVNNAL